MERWERREGSLTQLMTIHSEGPSSHWKGRHWWAAGDAAEHGEDANVGYDDGISLVFGEEDRVGCVGGLLE